MRRAGQNSLGTPVDDLALEVGDKVEAALTEWFKDKRTLWADQAYDHVMERLDKDKEILTTEMVDAAKPKMLEAAHEIFDHVDTQARLGEAQDAFIQKLAVASIATALATWALVRYAGGKK